MSALAEEPVAGGSGQEGTSAADALDNGWDEGELYGGDAEAEGSSDPASAAGDGAEGLDFASDGDAGIGGDYADATASELNGQLEGSDNPADSDGESEDPDRPSAPEGNQLAVELYDALTSQPCGTLGEAYAGYPFVAIVGAADDAATQAAVDQAVQLAGAGAAGEVRFAVLDPAGQGAGFSSLVGENASGSVAAYSLAGSDIYAQWAADLYAQCAPEGDAAAYPYVFAFDEAGALVMYGCGETDVAMLLASAFGVEGAPASQETPGEEAEAPSEGDLAAPDTGSTGGDDAAAQDVDSPGEENDDAEGVVGDGPAKESTAGAEEEEEEEVELSSMAEVPAGDVALYDAATGESCGTLLDVYGGKKTVVIVGYEGGYYTDMALSKFSTLVANPLYDDVHFAVFDSYATGSTFADEYGKYANDRVKLYSRKNFNGYRMWAVQTLSDFNGGFISGSYPYVLVMDESGTIIDCSTSMDRIPQLVSEDFGIDDPTYHTYDVEVGVEVRQTEARKLLDLVNAARAEKGVAPLTWDVDLEETAMQRASELVVLFEHERPDGSTCFTAWPPGYTTAAENIASGYRDANSANTGWTNSPGHYKNMINENVTTFAASLVVANGNRYYWVECFSTGDGTGFTTVAFDGQNTYSVTITEPQAQSLSLRLDGTDVTDTTIPAADAGYFQPDDVMTLVPYMRLERGNHPASPTGLAWTSSDESVATVSGSGDVTAVAPGTATITVSLPDEALSASCTVKVTGVIGEANVSDVANVTYTGNALTPKPTVTVGGNTLQEGVDYTLAYANNVNAGTATVTVTGCGVYVGQVSRQFTIARAVPLLPRATAGNQTYTGSALKPPVEVVVSGVKLSEGQDYTVAYSNNVQAGTASFVVTFTRNYQGTVSGSFEIERASIENAQVTLDQTVYRITGQPITPDPTVVLGGTTLVKGTDYTVAYANNIGVGTATVTVTGKGNYQGTTSTTFTIEKPNISTATVSVSDQIYTGEELRPAVTVVFEGEQLVSGSDYTVAYSKNVNVGSAKVTITGIGTYGGTATATFAIRPATIGENGRPAVGYAAWIAEGSVYFKDDTTPDVTLEREGTALRAGVDFDVAYAGNTIDPRNGVFRSQATATITGKGNYTGSIEVPYEVYCRVVNKAVEGQGTVELRSATLYPKAGETVTFRTIPATGMYTKIFNVTYIDPVSGEFVKLTVGNGGLQRTAGTGAAGTVAEYSFTMPDCDVAINSTFVANDTKYPIRKDMTGTGAAGSNLMLVGSDGKTAGQTSDSVVPTMLPRAGQTVYFKSVPARGARLTKFNVTYAYTALDGTAKTAKLVTGSGITSHGGGLYSFTMPCYPVTLTGEFTK